jgi:hypothetical protein
VFTEEGTPRISLKITALFSIYSSDRIYTLVWKGGVSIMNGAHIFNDDHSKHHPIGSMISLEKISPEAKRFDSLFGVVELSPEISKELSSSLRQAAISKDVSCNIFGKRPMSVRHLASDRAPGYLVGDVTNSIIKAAGTEVTLDGIALAKSRGQKAFAKPGDGGLPIISSSGALLGFIIANGKDGTAILPAEDLAQALSASFLTPMRGSFMQGKKIRPQEARPGFS